MKAKVFELRGRGGVDLLLVLPADDASIDRAREQAPPLGKKQQVESVVPVMADKPVYVVGFEPVSEDVVVDDLVDQSVSDMVAEIQRLVETVAEQNRAIDDYEHAIETNDVADAASEVQHNEMVAEVQRLNEMTVKQREQLDTQASSLVSSEEELDSLRENLSAQAERIGELEDQLGVEDAGDEGGGE